MDKRSFSDDSSDEDNLSYLLASGILPFVACSETIIRPVASQKGKISIVLRNFAEAMGHLDRDYFGDSPKYIIQHLGRRFRAPRSEFRKLEDALTGPGIFVHRTDALQKKRIHLRFRITATLRVLAYGKAADSLDEYLQMSDDYVLLSKKGYVSKLSRYSARSICAVRWKPTCVC